MREADASARARFPAGDWNVAMVTAELAQALAANGDLAEAREVAAPTLRILAAGLPVSDPRVRPLATILGS